MANGETLRVAVSDAGLPAIDRDRQPSTNLDIFPGTGRHRRARTGLFRAAVVGFAAAAIVLVPALPASASTILLITPSTVQPGFPITISATCGGNTNPAIVTSKVFGTITLLPSNGKLHTSVTVPVSTAPATYDVSLTCADGTTTTNTLTVERNTPAFTPIPNIGPATGGGEMAASTGARIAAYGGIGAIGIGIVVWIAVVRRRRRTLRL
jgi:hypothetical protein